MRKTFIHYMLSALMLFFCSAAHAQIYVVGGTSKRFSSKTSPKQIRRTNSTEGKILILSQEIGDVTYSLYKTLDKTNVRPNADGWNFYNATLELYIIGNNQSQSNDAVQSYLVATDLYLDEGDGQPQCMAVDYEKGKIFIFSSSKSTGRNYAMDGFCFVSPISNICFTAENVFTYSNWGWMPYFTYIDGTLALQHFSFAGYYAMTSVRNEDGSWNTTNSGSIKPDDFYNQSTEHATTLVIGAPENEAPKYYPTGDVNLDEKVDISDVVAIINTMAGSGNFTHSDVNADGYTDISDVVMVINIMASGVVDEFVKVEIPEESELRTSDMDFYVNGEKVEADSNGVLNAKEGDVVAMKDDKIVYMSYGAEDPERILNAEETAVSLLLPTVPLAVTDMDDLKLFVLKQMILYLPETKSLAEAISRSIVSNGCLDMDYVMPEFKAAVKEIERRFGLEPSDLVAARKKRLQIQSTATYPLFLYGGKEAYGDGFSVILTDSKKSEKGDCWKCTYTLLNADRFVYTSFTKGHKNEQGYFNRSDNSFSDTFRNLVKPMNVSEFMDLGSLSDFATDPNFKNFFNLFYEHDYDRVINQFWEPMKNLGHILKGEETETVTYDKVVLSGVEFEMFPPNDHLVVVGPGICEELKFFNFMKLTVQPVLKLIVKQIKKTDGYKKLDWSDKLFEDFIHYLFTKNYDSYVKWTATIADSSLSIGEKLEIVPEILKKLLGFITDEASDLAWKKLIPDGKGYTDPKVKTIFSALKTGYMAGDFILFCLDQDYQGVAFEVDYSNKPYSCPDENHPHTIDLGIGVKFSCCNLGAANPWESGKYFAWGETDYQKKSYDWSNYTHCDGTKNSCHDIGNEVGGTSNDAAKKYWGGSWRMPRLAEINVMLEKCSSKWANFNGIYGRVITGPNGNSIFVPASGYKMGEYTEQAGSSGNYWLSTGSTDEISSAFYLNLSEKRIETANEYRYVGMNIRPVWEEDSYLSCPDSNHPHIIDMGEAGKWSCCNVGASAPWEYGGYYAWGETEEKDYYYWDTYIHCDGDYDTCHNLGSDIAGTQYDVAHVKWGGKWRMPSHDQQMLLLDNCSSEWTEVNGINGRKFTAPNGGTIFLPAAGYRWTDGTYYVGSYGNYWSSTQYPSYAHGAYGLDFKSGGTRWDYGDRNDGQSVRPVTE